MIGNVKLEVIDLCRPCRHLSEKLKKDNIIKEFLRKGGIRCEVLNDGKGGIRCEVLNDGKISINDQIKII